MPRVATLAAHPSRSRVLTEAVAETARRLEIGPSDLGTIIGISQPSASKLFRGQFALKERTKEWELAAYLVRLYRSLVSTVGNDALALTWLKSRNRAFGDQAPSEIIKRVDGLVHACEYLDAHRAHV